MLNIQPIEKNDQRDDGSLDVHGVFPTIQGEGPLTGHPATFVRLAGCNLQCPLCDTDYTSQRERMSPEALMNKVRALHPGPRLVVITGGEPFRQNITLFVLLLLDEGYQVQIETNGTLPPPSGLPGFEAGVWVVVSPKAAKVNPHTEALACAWKYVLRAGDVNLDDGLPLRALDHSVARQVARPPNGFPVGAVYVQPCDESFCIDEPMARTLANSRNRTAVVGTCLQHGYTVQLQLHKILNME